MLLKSFPGVAFDPVIADLRHARRLAQVFDRHCPDTIFHAAAHKHVPLMEENVVEAITNNILGTGNLVEAATACAAQTFVLISTDKAVRPTSVMGCTKRVAEQIEAGGPVTVTHPEMRRYFMTIPEAVQLVLQAGALGKSGELFALDMGEQVKIVDLATAGLIETLIQSALTDPDNWDALRIQLRALVPDFHVPPPPPPVEDSDKPAAAVSGERRLHLA